MSDKQDWSSSEKFFARSWTHIFYFWKLRQIMLAKTVKNLLKKRQVGESTRVVDLGCGPGTNLFDVYDVCADFKQVEWFGLDLNQREAAMGAGRSAYRVQERKMQRVLKSGGYAMVTTPNPRNLPELLGYGLDKITLGWFKRFYWKGQDEVSAPALDAEVGFGHVSVHPFPVWRDWFAEVGLPVVKKVRGPLVFGSPFFDRQRFLLGLLIMLDSVLDKLPFRFLTTTNLGMLCRKP